MKTGTKFNRNNTGYQAGKYPLFLGEELGFPDTVNQTYPVLEELYAKQIAQIWSEFEIGLSQDILEMTQLPETIVHPMKLTIMTQTYSDAMASRSIVPILMPHCSNQELENLLSLWGLFETIHSRTYAHIIKQTFEDPNEMMEEAYKNEKVMLRSDVIRQALDEAANIPDDADILDKQVIILKALTAIFGLEGIMFMSSFAVTFGIAETGVFQGISKLVELICKDESQHIRFTYEIFEILKKDPDWELAFTIAVPDMKDILDDIVKYELEWSDYVFEEGQIAGLTPELLQDYVLYMSKPIYKTLGIPFKLGKDISENPLKYMEKYIDSTTIQVANQELQSGQYQIGAILQDDDNIQFDDLLSQLSA